MTLTKKDRKLIYDRLLANQDEQGALIAEAKRNVEIRDVLSRDEQASTVTNLNQATSTAYPNPNRIDVSKSVEQPTSGEKTKPAFNPETTKIAHPSPNCTDESKPHEQPTPSEATKPATGPNGNEKSQPTTPKERKVAKKTLRIKKRKWRNVTVTGDRIPPRTSNAHLLHLLSDYHEVETKKLKKYESGLFQDLDWNIKKEHIKREYIKKEQKMNTNSI